MFTCGKNAVMTPECKTIYFLPVGNIDKKLQKDVKKFIKAFYYGTNIKTLKDVSEKQIREYPRIQYYEEEN